MQTLENEQDKIKKICAVLRNETLEPAQKEAKTIIENAHQQADQIIAEAQKKVEKLHANAKAAIEQEQSVFQSSLHQAAKQMVETLRQSIESKFFNETLSGVIEKGVSDPNLVVSMITAIVKALEKDGLDANLTAVVAKNMVPAEINQLLSHEVLNKLQGGAVTLGNFSAGVQLKLNNKKMTIDLSEAALKELLSTYIVRKDFRKMFFDDHISE